ncbi:MAG: response regulator [Bacteroidetes bacterium]|nr:response regulator [Bacteroidota bacterium]
MDGYEATKRIRAMKHGEDTVIIALSAGVFEEERAIALLEGCNDFVCKPYHETDIFDSMHKHLGVRFVYESSGLSSLEDNKIPQEPGDLISALAVLPSDLLSRLEESAAICDTEAIEQSIDEVRQYDPSLSEALTGVSAVHQESWLEIGFIPGFLPYFSLIDAYFTAFA